MEILRRPRCEQVADPIRQEGSRCLVAPKQGVKRDLHALGELRHAPEGWAELTPLGTAHAVHRQTCAGGQLALRQPPLLPELADVAPESSRVVQIQPPGMKG